MLMATPAPIATDDVEDVSAILLRRLRLLDRVSGGEAEVLRHAIQRVELVDADKVLIAAGTPLKRSVLLLDGFLARYKELPDGARQITDIHVPGDFVDLHGFLLKSIEHDVASLTAARVAYVPHTALTAITEHEPHLARLLWLTTLIDAAMQREHLLSIGRRSAVARVAHLFCELYCRMASVGLAENHSFTMQITQLDLADTTGLTSVHVNRMLRKLRDDGLMTFRNGLVELHDFTGLTEAAGFDPSYLTIASEPR